MTSLSPDQIRELSHLLQKAASGQMPVRGQHFEILGKFGSVSEAASAARYAAGSDAALASLGLDKHAFAPLAALGTGVAAGARALAPHVGKAVQGVATAGRRLGTGLAQAGRAAAPHLQQAGQQAKTMAQNAWNTARPVLQSAGQRVGAWAKGMSSPVLDSGVPGVASAVNS